MFIAYNVSLDLVRGLRPVIPQLRRHDAELADQRHRAATCIVLNLGEGQRSRGGNIRRHYDLAHGSASEVRAGLDLAEAWGWLADTSELRITVDRLLALLWRLTHPRNS
jgi:four helix bundle protein